MEHSSQENYRVLVLDMQPIDPPVGGGRLRLLGLYHGLGSKLPTRYIGSYDWPGEKFRKQMLSDSLEEILIPMSPEHFSESEKWQERVGGRTVIDVTFFQFAHLSPGYVGYARRAVLDAEIVIFSHPWIYPIVKDLLNRDHQLIIYDAQNVEGLLRTTLLDDGDLGTQVVKKAVMAEYEVCHSANIILACSHEDRVFFHRFYKIPFEKIRVIPNGVFTNQILPVDKTAQITAKEKLGFENNPLALFIGSAYPPNLEAADFICRVLAPTLPDVEFAICGSVGDKLDERLLKCTNVTITGFLDENEKLLYFNAADIAINPMASGSGTNIKMFEYLAAGLPVITTEIGARGIEEGAEAAFIVSSKNRFSSGVSALIRNDERKNDLSIAGRKLAEEKYSWERISRNLGNLLYRLRSKIRTSPPFFSVIVPSYERHDHLSKLMDRLSSQEKKDFEVIVVDQSPQEWAGSTKNYGFDIFYVHTDVKGAVKARNLAAFFSRGKVLAFTDDDCEPWPDWLKNALPYFDQPDVIGIEGLIETDKHDHNNYRIVTNDGFEGIGFMTANLFLKSEIFNSINGFDERFDSPHFREDTDLAWRALPYGKIPFSRNVRILHPAHPRKIDRESFSTRNRYFEKDALLAKKHPRRYMDLLLSEGHWENRPGFWEPFRRGAAKYNVNVTDILSEFSIEGGSRCGVCNGSFFEILPNLIKFADVDLPIEIPHSIAANLSKASELVKKVKAIVGSNTHESYFESSINRYQQYFAAAMTLGAKSKVLDIGNAPGHVAIGLHLLGMDVQGINLNDEWNKTYPSAEWLSTFNVISHDIEKASLPFDDNIFDAVFFTEILEHIAVTDPLTILTDIRRVLRPGGLLIFSTPNVCNISNIYTLLKGKNIFWPPEIFYGSFGRHNREYTPYEVSSTIRKADFKNLRMYGFNCDSNWQAGSSGFISQIVMVIGESHPLMKNTIMALAEG